MAIHPQIITADKLGSNLSIALPTFTQGRLSVAINIDNGSGAAMSDTPIGTWQLHASFDNVNFCRVLNADADLAKLAAAGNVVVNGLVTFSDVPGVAQKLLYVRTSGGGTNTVCNAWVEAT